MAGKTFAVACQLGVVGGLIGAWRYRSEYGHMNTKATHSENALHTYSTNHRRDVYDVAVVGGGIVGVATAREIRLKYPNKRVVLLEKEADVAQHQSGRNSGCIHAGMFNTPGTILARLCPRGHDLMIEYCKKNKLPYELCGKLVVATKPEDMATVEELYHNGVTNGVKGLQVLRSQEEIQKREPLVSGVGALWSPTTGIADFAEVTRHMLRELMSGAKGRFFDSHFQFEALDFVGVKVTNPKAKSRTGEGSGGREADGEELVLIRGREPRQLGPEKTILAKHVITCCGLSSDVVARHSGSVLERIGKQVMQTYSFRGRYYQAKPSKKDCVSAHVYPCPDHSRVHSVGVHFTRTCDVRRGNQLIIGPGSAFALDRYGYTSYTMDLQYCFNCAFSKGGWVSLWRNFGAIAETYYADLSRRRFLAEAQRLIPSFTLDDIEDSFCGVMSIGVVADGTLSMDLAMELARPRLSMIANMVKGKKLEPVPDVSGTAVAESREPLILNVRNAPSPAATASLAVAEDIVATASRHFKWDQSAVAAKLPA